MHYIIWYSFVPYPLDISFLSHELHLYRYLELCVQLVDIWFKRIFSNCPLFSLLRTSELYGLLSYILYILVLLCIFSISLCKGMEGISGCDYYFVNFYFILLILLQAVLYKIFTISLQNSLELSSKARKESMEIVDEKPTHSLRTTPHENST